MLLCTGDSPSGSAATVAIQLSPCMASVSQSATHKHPAHPLVLLILRDKGLDGSGGSQAAGQLSGHARHAVRIQAVRI